VAVSHLEEPPFTDGDPARYVLEMAEAKGRAVSGSHPRSWVVAADTIVIIGHEVLGKPKTEKEAISMLGRLSGRWHEVITAFCLLHHEKGAAYKKAVQSRVKIKKLTMAEVTSYVVTGEPMDKAGAYAVQGIGAFMVEKIAGSYTNVVGLPLSEVIEAMQAVGIIRPRVAFSVQGVPLARYRTWKVLLRIAFSLLAAVGAASCCEFRGRYAFGKH